jgi:hypothetical protein
MRRLRKAKAARVAPAALAKRHNWQPHRSARRIPPQHLVQRSAANWFIDAAVYASDGDDASARKAARQALYVLRAS